MNILMFCQFNGGYSAAFREKAAQITKGHDVIYASDQQWTEDEYHTALGQADIVVSFIPKRDMKYCRKMKLMLLDIAGVDGYIDSPFLPEDAVICNATGAYGKLLAEHAVCLALSICRDIPLYVSNKEKHTWHMRKPDKPIEGSSVLILGAGDIGAAIARDIRPMLGSGTITGVRRVSRGGHPDFDRIIGLEELENDLPNADIIFCALPQTKETKGLLNREKMSRMKDDAVLVNVGRGSLIPLEDLVYMLDGGKFRGVGIDVAEYEPIPPDHPVWDCERLIITPHAAGNAMTQDSPTGKRLCELLLLNLENYLQGKPLVNKVSRQTGYRETALSSGSGING